MTTTDPRSTAIGTGRLQPRSLDELEFYLRPAHFPARLDQLLATLARHRAPSRVYWLLASLPLSSSFDDLPQLLSALGATGQGTAVPGRQPHPEPL